MLLVDLEPTQIIMVSYFRPNDFRKSVDSILINTSCPFHLYIIDNSHGGLDKELDQVETDPRVTTYRNDNNLGKGAAVNKWYQKIMGGSSLSHFVSIDSDIQVPPGWLLELKRALSWVQKPAMIAPAIVSKPGNTFKKQLENQRLDMHRMGNLYQVDYNGLFYNRYTAGPLFLIDRKFFESVGLYYQDQLYGADDGKLCKAAAKQNRFIGINSNVEVLHLNEDSTEDYNEWKRRNITKDVDQCGHWD